jgi:hypothetical protein
LPVEYFHQFTIIACNPSLIIIAGFLHILIANNKIGFKNIINDFVGEKKVFLM